MDEFTALSQIGEGVAWWLGRRICNLEVQVSKYFSNATRWIFNTANGLIPVSSLSYVMVRMSAVLKKTVVDMFNYYHPGDHTRRTINGLVFGGPKFSSLVLLNSKLISLQSVGFFNNVLVLFTIFVSLFIVYLRTKRIKIP